MHLFVMLLISKKIFIEICNISFKGSINAVMNESNTELYEAKIFTEKKVCYFFFFKETSEERLGGQIEWMQSENTITTGFRNARK